jgi:hypothetical protein
MTCSCGDPKCDGPIDPDHIAKTIAKHGQQVIAVYGANEGEPPFVYTIGRTARGQPELLVHVVEGQALRAAGAMLNELADLDLRPGDWIACEALLCDYVAMAPTGRLDDWIHEAGVIQADAYYGRRVEVLYLGPAIRTEEVMH